MLLDHVQADEERDIEENPESDDPETHIVYVIRRLRRSLTTKGMNGNIERCACGRELHADGDCPDGGAWCG